MKHAVKSVLVGVAAAAGLSLVASAASAAIVCNAEGDCWHVKNRYAYRPEFGVVVHPNNWRWTAADHYRWREHEGRGYWKNGIWIRF